MATSSYGTKHSRYGMSNYPSGRGFKAPSYWQGWIVLGGITAALIAACFLMSP